MDRRSFFKTAGATAALVAAAPHLALAEANPPDPMSPKEKATLTLINLIHTENGRGQVSRGLSTVLNRRNNLWRERRNLPQSIPALNDIFDDEIAEADFTKVHVYHCEIPVRGDVKSFEPVRRFVSRAVNTIRKTEDGAYSPYRLDVHISVVNRKDAEEFVFGESPSMQAELLMGYTRSHEIFSFSRFAPYEDGHTNPVLRVSIQQPYMRLPCLQRHLIGE